MKIRLGLLLALACGGALEADEAPHFPYCPPPVVDATTLKGKFMFGYQGWFGYPGDSSTNNAWFHWRRDKDGQPHSMTDMLPDVSEYDSDELFPSGLTRRDNSPLLVYSAYRARTVERHFEWMRQYGLDGVFLQRFLGELSRAPEIRDFRDQVTRNVAGAAEKNGRVFALMYDISNDGDALEQLERDWIHLVDDLKVTQSPRYLRHQGKPVLAVWGLGFPGNLSAKQAAQLVDFLKNNPRPDLRVTLMGGVPTHWRTLSGDSLPQPEWAGVYRSLDIVSPWSVGRFADLRGADHFLRDNLAPDLAEAAKAHVEYMPVLYPGYSAHNLSYGSKPINEIRRQGGVFFWHQVKNAMDAGATMLYGAMFDEVDEGTAFYKVIPDSGLLPTQESFLSLDADGYVLPSDWYLKLAGLASMSIQGKFKSDSPMPLDLRKVGQYEGCFQCGGGAPLSRGKVISINFVGGGGLGAPEEMAKSEEAGMVRAAFWNNAASDAGSLGEVQDGAGQKTSASVLWHSGGLWSTPIGDRAGDFRMMKGYLDTSEGTSVTVQVSGLPQPFTSKGYTVYVYSDGDDREATRRAVFTLGGRSIEAVDPPLEFFDGNYKVAENGKAGNVVIFSGLKGSHFELAVTPGTSTGKNRRAPVNGMQIVAAP